MQFRHLQQVSTQVITDTFNEAFSDYVVPMHFTEEEFKAKMLRDGLQPEHSVGAFAGDRLVGFILQGIGDWGGTLTAYNGGTGVIPDFRRQKLTQQLYGYNLPRLKAMGVRQCLLEVVQTNKAAVKTYEALGFKITRNLISYKGFIKNQNPTTVKLVESITFREAENVDWQQVEAFWDYSPSWGYTIAALNRVKPLTTFIQVELNNLVIGYGALHTNTNRIAQFAIAPAYRRKGLGTLLFRKLARNQADPLAVINVDESSTGTNQFLQNLGLTTYINQYEMLLPIPA